MPYRKHLTTSVMDFFPRVHYLNKRGVRTCLENLIINSVVFSLNKTDNQYHVIIVKTFDSICRDRK